MEFFFFFQSIGRVDVCGEKCLRTVYLREGKPLREADEASDEEG